MLCAARKRSTKDGNKTTSCVPRAMIASFGWVIVREHVGSKHSVGSVAYSWRINCNHSGLKAARSCASETRSLFHCAPPAALKRSDEPHVS